MARITTTLLLLAVAVVLNISPLFRLIGRVLGAQLKSKSQQRRAILLERSKEEAKANAVRPGAKTHSSASLDEDWENVQSEGKTPPQKPVLEQDENFNGIIGFFHPFCNAGGGGERVLFAAVLATQQRYPNALCAVYTGDHDASKDQILVNVRNRFNIQLDSARIAFLYLSTRDYILPSKWPHFTLLGQSLGSLVLGWDAFSLLTPDIFIDTMGHAFTLWLSKWLFPTVPTGAYVHYPTISTDMLESLHDDSGNQGLNSGHGKGLRGRVKQFYWESFAKLYGRVGGSVDVVMTNSSWTQKHISALWTTARTSRRKEFADITVVYPPCAVEELEVKIPVNADTEAQRRPDVLYIAQFRPEKQHQVIIDAFAAFLKSHPDIDPKPRLVLAGSVRDDSDEKRVYMLRLQAQEIKDSVQFHINAKWPQILDLLRSSSVGVNGMWNEHFGIGVVEYQAAGLISVVNASGGPKADIVVPIDGQESGFHATTPEEYAARFASALSLSTQDRLAMRLRARKSAQRFSEAVFERAWLAQMDRLVAMCKQ